MPVHKRSWSDNLHDEEPANDKHHHAKQSRPEREPEKEEEGEEEGEREEREDYRGGEEQVQKQEEDEQEGADSEGSPSSTSSEEKPEFAFVELRDIRKDVQCPICLGIIKKTRTVMECLHRFCRECIDKSMRLGNNECPACRTHCASRRSLRDDPNYDALIAALYPDIDKYEEEELAFHEVEKNRNKQIQESIAQIIQRQTEALAKKRMSVKDTRSGITTRSQRHHRNAYLRRRNGRGVELQESEEDIDDEDNNGGSSTDERFTQVKQRRQNRRTGIRLSQPSSSLANGDDGCTENDLDISRENQGSSPGMVWNSEMLAWGRGGARTHPRHGSAGGVNNKSSRSTRLTKLVDYLRGLEENNDELDVHLILISLDHENVPGMQQPHLCCRPSLSVEHLREYVAQKTPLQAEEIEILAVKGIGSTSIDQMTHTPSFFNDAAPFDLALTIDPSRDELQILEGTETLAGLKSGSCRDYLILGYRRKEYS